MKLNMIVVMTIWLPRLTCSQAGIAAGREGEVRHAAGQRLHPCRIEVDHAPDPAASIDRLAIMDLTRVHCDQIAGRNLDLAASRGRGLCAAVDQPDAKLIMGMARKAAG